MSYIYSLNSKRLFKINLVLFWVSLLDMQSFAQQRSLTVPLTQQWKSSILNQTMTDNSMNAAIQKKIKVCFVSIDIYPLFNTQSTGVQGGSEVDFYMIATELAKDTRFQVSIVTGDFGQQEIETADNITVYKAAGIRKNLFLGAMSLWKAMRRADADVYFKKGASVTTDMVALFCRFNDKSFFLRTGHDIDCDGSYLRQYPLRGKSYLWSLKQAKYVFVQKTSDVNNLFRTTRVNAIAVPNGHRISDSPGQLQRDSILWVGRSADFKQPQLFINLAKQISAEKFIMICQQTKGDNYYNSLVSLSEGVANLKFLKYVPFHEIKDYFWRAKVFVNTSQAEGFANTFIQAGKCAVPILTLNVNPDGFLEKYNCGICCNGDMDKMAAALKYLLEQNRYIEIGLNAKKYVEQNHDITKIIERYKQHFVEAVTKSFL